jgi:hypothetical protein
MQVFRANPHAEAMDKYNWIRTSENYERIYLNKYHFCLATWHGLEKKSKMSQPIRVQGSHLGFKFIEESNKTSSEV